MATAARRGSVKLQVHNRSENIDIEEIDRITHELLARRLFGEALCGFGEGHTTADALLSLVFLRKFGLES
jgi:hypothetical protein